MSLRIASVVAWIWGVLSLVTSLGPLSRFGGLSLAGRTTAIWFLCAGIALVVVGFGLSRRRLYAARIAIVVSGLWFVTLVIAIVRHLGGSGTWSSTDWIIILSQVLFCVVIARVVFSNRRLLGEAGETTVAHSNAA
jgi:hypothetical protein